MDLTSIFSDKATKPSEKTAIISKQLVSRNLSLSELMEYAEKAKAPQRATCIEALEYLTKQDPKAANSDCIDFAIQFLAAKEPRVQWESSRVIANIAHLFPQYLEAAIPQLVLNAKSPGTVVRWSSALALSNILKSAYSKKEELAEIIIKLAEKEEKSSIQKIYHLALKDFRKK